MTWENGPKLESIVFADDGSNPGAGEGDTITFTFDEAIDKNTVGITAVNNKLSGTLTELITQIGTFIDNGDTTTDDTSEMEYSNSSPYTLTITLGTIVNSGSQPSGTFDAETDINLDGDITDAAGNPIHTSNAVGQSDKWDMTAPGASASPSGGSYGSAQSVVLSSADDYELIYYTTDGSPPTTGSATYSTGITVGSGTTTIRFFAIDSYSNSGSVIDEEYIIQ